MQFCNATCLIQETVIMKVEIDYTCNLKSNDMCLFGDLLKLIHVYEIKHDKSLKIYLTRLIVLSMMFKLKKSRIFKNVTFSHFKTDESIDARYIAS